MSRPEGGSSGAASWRRRPVGPGRRLAGWVVIGLVILQCCGAYAWAFMRPGRPGTGPPQAEASSTHSRRGSAVQGGQGTKRPSGAPSPRSPAGGAAARGRTAVSWAAPPGKRPNGDAGGHREGPPSSSSSSSSWSSSSSSRGGPRRGGGGGRYGGAGSGPAGRGGSSRPGDGGGQRQQSGHRRGQGHVRRPRREDDVQAQSAGEGGRGPPSPPAAAAPVPPGVAPSHLPPKARSALADGVLGSVHQPPRGAGFSSPNRTESQLRVIRIISGKEYGANDVLDVVADPAVADFLRLRRSDGYVKALFRLSALLVGAKGMGDGSGGGGGKGSGGNHRWLHTDARFLHLLDRLAAQAGSSSGLSAQSYSKVLTALAHLQHVPSRRFLDTLRDGMLARMAQAPDWFDPYSLSHIISAFLNLGYHPGTPFMLSFTEGVANQLMEFHPVGLMSVIRGLARLGHDPGAPFLRLFTSCAKRKLPEFPPRALSSTIQGLATLKHHPPPEFMAALVERMDQELENFSWLDIPNAVTAFSKLGHVPPEPFLRRLVARARQELPSFNPQAMCNFIFGLFKLGMDPGVDFMADFFAACEAKLGKFTPAGFSSMLHSCARLGYYPGEEFMRAFEAETAPQLAAFTKGELWKLGHALATLNHRPGEGFLAAFFASFLAKGHTLTVKDVSLVLWSLAVLDAGAGGAGHAAALAQLADLAAELVARHQLDPQGDEYASRSGGDDPAILKYRQLVQAGMYLRTLGDPAVDAAVRRLDAALQEAWRRKLQAMAAEQQREQQPAAAAGAAARAAASPEAEAAPASPSLSTMQQTPTPTFHAHVLETARDAGLRFDTGTLNEVFNVELLLYPWEDMDTGARGEPEDQRPVVILLEGRGHFFTNALSRQTGDAEFRHALVRHAAEREGIYRAVGQLTVWEWRAVTTRAGRLRLLAHKLEELGLDAAMYLPPGAMQSQEEEGHEGEEGGGDSGGAAPQRQGGRRAGGAAARRRDG